MPIALSNGINYSSANVTAIIPILGPLTGITKIEYKRETVVEDNYGLGQDPTSRGFGQNKYTASITIYKEVLDKIIAVSPLRDPAKLPLFDITVTFGGAGVPFKKETLKAVTLKVSETNVGAGDTKLLVTIPLAVGLIEF